MNILVIGNGFDLAHGLPTKYTDFLNWIVEEYNLYCEYKKKGIHMHKIELQVPIKNIEQSFSKNTNWVNDSTQYMEFLNCIDKNIWIEYFLYIKNRMRENWIDFESEIKNVIKSIDQDIQMNATMNNIEHLSNEYINERIFALENSGKLKKFRIKKQSLSYDKIIKKLYRDLNRLIRALELYLTKYVRNLEYKEISPDIRNIYPNKILCFNYTNTYEKIYGGTENIEFDYIHGEALEYLSMRDNNMVLGIDEYLSDDRKNKDTEFIAFKKFYQRIYKQTGCTYKRWVDEIRNDKKNVEDELKYDPLIQIPFEQYKHKGHYLYIFGHSLDITDGDILRDLILNDNVYTTIFYLNKDVMGQQVANLVKVIGQDELIRRTGGSTKTIEFVPQKPMEPINVKESIED